MDVLAQTEGKTYGSLVSMDAAGCFGSFSRGESFACLIWDHNGHATSAQRHAFARLLLEAGCRYAVCAGENCESWHDAIDTEWVDLHLDDPEEVHDATHVMTTWHNGESPEDVAFYFVHNTNIDGHELKKYFVLHIGTGPAKQQVDDAVRSSVLDQ